CACRCDRWRPRVCRALPIRKSNSRRGRRGCAVCRRPRPVRRRALRRKARESRRLSAADRRLRGRALLALSLGDRESRNRNPKDTCAGAVRCRRRRRPGTGVRMKAGCASLLSAVDAGKPVTAGLLVRVDVVHAGGVPAGASSFQNRTMTNLDFSIIRRRQFEDLESPHGTTVARPAILCEAKEFVVELQDASGGAGAALIFSYYRTARMFEPWAKQLGGGIKMERVVLVGRRTGKQPPPIVVVDDRRIREAPADQACERRPARGKFAGFVERDRAGVDGFGQHVIC